MFTKTGSLPLQGIEPGLPGVTAMQSIQWRKAWHSEGPAQIQSSTAVLTEFRMIF